MSLTIKGRPIHFSLKWLKPPPVPPDGTMTLFEHLRELRYRLIVSALAIIVGMVGLVFSLRLDGYPAAAVLPGHCCPEGPAPGC
jgi:hypothetical protein